MHITITTTLRRRSKTAAVVTLAALTLAACGGTESTDPAAVTSSDPAASASPDDTSSDMAMQDAFPVTIADDNGEVVIAAQPMSIVSISPTSTEILFAIGAGDQVIAVDDYSNFPPEAPVTDLSGFTPNLEAILGFGPDLVIVSYDPGDIVDGLKAADVPTLVHGSAQTLADSYRQIEQLGVATGRVADAAKLVAEMQSDLDALVASLPDEAAGLTYYHELDNTYFTATSSTFIGELYGLFGLENIADAADPDGESFGFPQLSAEYIVDANPDLIFLADTKCCDVTTASVAERDGWASVKAVETGAVIELDDDIASRWGPRVVDYLRVIAEAIEQLVAA